MPQFKLEDYEPVEERIKRFYKDHPDGRIHTEMVNSPDKPDTAIFKASVFVADVHVSDGWAMEREGDGYVNKTSHIENCETSAIGRALANFNYQGSRRPSREEMQKVNAGEEKKKPDLTTLIKSFSFMKDEVFTDDERDAVKFAIGVSRETPDPVAELEKLHRTWHEEYKVRTIEKQANPAPMFGEDKKPEDGLIF